MPRTVERSRAYSAARIAYNRGRFDLAREINDAIEAAATVDADKLRAILWPNMGGTTESYPTHDERNSYELDKRRRMPDYVGHRVASKLDGD